MKKILLVYSGDVSTSATGGIKNYIYLFIKYRTDVCIDLLAVCQHDIPADLNVNRFIAIKTKIRPVLLGFIWQVILGVITKRIKLQGYDAVLFNRHEEALMGLLLPTSKKYLLIHGSIKYGFCVWPKLVAYLNLLLETIIITKMDATYILLKNKEYGLPYYKSRFCQHAEKLHYAPVPIDVHFLQPVSINSYDKNSMVKGIYFGRITDNPKNVMLLPEYVKVFRDKGINLVLTIAGAGPDLARLKDKVVSLDLDKYIVFQGNVSHEDLPALISNHHFCFILSDFEGICMSALESLAMGVPVAAYPVGDIPEYIVDMKNGVILNRADGINSSVDKIIAFLKQYNFSESYLDYIRSYYPPDCFSVIEL